MIRCPWIEFRGKRVLLLQGPVGPFFWGLARALEAAGAEVHKVNFNGGDCLFYPTGAAHWRGSLEDWPGHFEKLLQGLDIDVVLLFGDCRPIHRTARKIAHGLGVKVGVFEEGYVRPNHITFEEYGVNGNSRIPRSPLFYRNLPRQPSLPEQEVGSTFWHAALWAISYYVASALMHPVFRRYRHHRPLTLREAFPWVRALARKWSYGWSERGVLEVLKGPLSKRFFLVPLQIPFDSQVKEHSDFDSVEQFIGYVVASFACNAPNDTALVIKHHPLDRGYHDYTHVLRDLAAHHGLAGRLVYIHDQHLPTLFNHMRGAVVINSTVGFSALSHGAPVKTCGVALYDMPGLTFQGDLDAFWREAQTFQVDRELHDSFRSYVIDQTQINGSIYRGKIGSNLRKSMLAAQHGHQANAPAFSRPPVNVQAPDALIYAAKPVPAPASGSVAERL
jgi:capsular polysaccharide export protein